MEELVMEFFKKSPIAYSCHRAIFDKQNMPCDYEYLLVNDAFETLMSIHGTTIINKSFYEVFPGGWEGENQWKHLVQNTVVNQSSAQFDLYQKSIQKWIRVQVFPLQRDIIGCIYHDVTKEYMLDYEIEGFLKVNIDMLCVADTKGNFLKVNKAFERILGYNIEDLEEKSFFSLIHPEDVPASWEAIKTLKEQKSSSSFVNRVCSKDGTYRYIEWHSQPNGGYIYTSGRDITETRKLELQLYKNNESLVELTKKLEQKNKILNDLAIKDELTGLYNRHFLDQWIEKEMCRADREHKPLSMIIFDLDHFKRVNDIWGHPVGDEVLKQTANLASNLISEPNFLVRLGGEEFIVVMPGSRVNQAFAVAEMIRQAMEKFKYPIVGQVTASFGIAERMEAESYYSWYKRTDKAMYRAKECGRNRVFSSDDQDRFLNGPVKIEWKQEWESGHPAIDEDHRELVEKANTLIYMSLSDTRREKIMLHVDIILDDIIVHFHDEEQILLEIGYPDYENHTEIHRTLLYKVFQFKEAFQNGEIKLAEFFSFIVNDLVVDHIINSDSEYFPYTRKMVQELN